MKKTTSFFLIITAYMLIIFACTNKEINLITTVELEFTQNVTTTGVVNDLIPATFTITPEVILPAFTYSFRYDILEGDGVFLNADQNPIPVGKPMTLVAKKGTNNFILDLNYKPTTPGNHRIQVTASDNFEKSFPVILNYTITDVEILWNSTSDTTVVEIGDIVPMTIKLQHNSNNPDLTFKRQYRFSQGTGRITEENNTDLPIVLDDFIPIEPGTHRIHVTPTQIGTTIINFDLISSNGHKLSNSISFETVQKTQNNTAEIVKFSINSVAGKIDKNTITITLPEGTDLTKLIPAITISENASVNPENNAAQNFTHPITYTVTAEDGITINEYKVIVTIDQTTVPATAITITPKSLNLIEGANKTLLSELTPGTVTNQTTIWSSDNTNIATVSKDGVVTAITTGKTSIRATWEGNTTIFDEIPVEVLSKTIPITALNVTPPKATITNGDTQQLQATITPKNATNNDILWESNDTSIATVDQNGLVTTKLPGDVMITATSQANPNISATATITIKEKIILPTEISINPPKATITNGDTQQLQATITPKNTTNNDILWESNDTSIATVDQNGLVTTKLPGDLMITATSQANPNISATATITIKEKIILPTEISINPPKATITNGDTQQLQATITPKNATNNDILWESNDTSIATVDQNGLVTTKLPGEVTITATSQANPNISATATITIKEKIILPTEISINPPKATITNGDTQQLQATITPKNATNNNILWESNDTSIATVDQNGLVTTKLPGEVTITATSQANPNISATATITIKEKIILPTEISINPPKATITNGDTQQLQATIIPKNATNNNILWESNDTSIATVDQNGLVTTKLHGNVTITATSQANPNISATATITIKEKIIPPTSINIMKENFQMDLDSGEDDQLTVQILPNSATNKNVTWSSSNENIIKVDKNGVVTPIGVGEANIIATSDGNRSLTDQVKVTVYVQITGLSITTSNPLNITNGQSKILNASVSPSNASKHNLVWSSYDTDIVRIAKDTKGNKTIYTAIAQKPGTSTITVRTADGKFTDSITINVITATPYLDTKTGIFYAIPGSEVEILAQHEEWTPDITINIRGEGKAGEHINISLTPDNVDSWNGIIPANGILHISANMGSNNGVLFIDCYDIINGTPENNHWNIQLDHSKKFFP